MNIYKKDFPIFQNEHPVFLDSAASTQKPLCVLDTIYHFYTTSYARKTKTPFGRALSGTRGQFRLWRFARHDRGQNRCRWA